MNDERNKIIDNIRNVFGIAVGDTRYMKIIKNSNFNEDMAKLTPKDWIHYAEWWLKKAEVLIKTDIKEKNMDPFAVSMFLLATSTELCIKAVIKTKKEPPLKHLNDIELINMFLEVKDESSGGFFPELSNDELERYLQWLGIFVEFPRFPARKMIVGQFVGWGSDSLRVTELFYKETKEFCVANS